MVVSSFYPVTKLYELANKCTYLQIKETMLLLEKSAEVEALPLHFEHTTTHFSLISIVVLENHALLVV